MLLILLLLLFIFLPALCCNCLAFFYLVVQEGEEEMMEVGLTPGPWGHPQTLTISHRFCFFRFSFLLNLRY